MFASYTQHPYWHDTVHPPSYIVFILIIILAFEIWMLVDVIRNKHVPTEHKVWWIIGMCLIHPIVAIVYLFVSRLHYNKQKLPTSNDK